MMQPTIGLAIIAVSGNPVHWEECLKSVKDRVQEIVIVDRDSPDETRQIGRQYNASLWNYSENDDFNVIRNQALSRLTTEWVLILNSDEHWDAGSEDLNRLFSQYPDSDGFYLPVVHPAPDPESVDIFPEIRLFRRLFTYRYQGITLPSLKGIEPQKICFATGPGIRQLPLTKEEFETKCRSNLKLLQQNSTAEPESSILHYELGWNYFGLGQFEEALSHFQKIAALKDADPLRTVAIRYLIRCLTRLNKSAEAIGICIKETKRYPDYCDLHFAGGLIFAEKQEYQLAIKWFQRALDRGTPPDGYHHTVGTEGFLTLYHLGYCYEAQKQFSDAEHFYQQAFTSNPDFFKPLKNLFLLKLAQSGPENAINHMIKTGWIQTIDHGLFLTKLLFEIGYSTWSSRCCRQILELYPREDDLRVQKYLAHYELYSGDPAAALAILDRLRSFSQDVDLPQIIDELIALALIGDYPAALVKSKTLLDQHPDLPEAWAVFTLSTSGIGHPLSGLPGPSRQPTVISSILTIIEQCFSYIPDGSNFDPLRLQRLNDLATLSIQTLIRLAPESAVALLDYLTEKENTIQKLVDSKFNIS